MNTAHKISIANDFSRYPAGRFETDGPYSGEKFRKELLEPFVSKGENLVIDLDGVRGYGSSFLEEAFGGLIREGYDASNLLDLISFETQDESLVMEIKSYISDAAV